MILFDEAPHQTPIPSPVADRNGFGTHKSREHLRTHEKHGGVFPQVRLAGSDVHAGHSLAQGRLLKRVSQVRILPGAQHQGPVRRLDPLELALSHGHTRATTSRHLPAACGPPPPAGQRSRDLGRRSCVDRSMRHGRRCAHARHQLTRARPGSGQGVSCVPQIMEVDIGSDARILRTLIQSPRKLPRRGCPPWGRGRRGRHSRPPRSTWPRQARTRDVVTSARDPEPNVGLMRGRITASFRSLLQPVGLRSRSHASAYSVQDGSLVRVFPPTFVSLCSSGRGCRCRHSWWAGCP